MEPGVKLSSSTLVRYIQCFIAIDKCNSKYLVPYMGNLLEFSVTREKNVPLPKMLFCQFEKFETKFQARFCFAKSSVMSMLVLQNSDTGLRA